MKLLVGVVVLLVSCTKPNPNLCCIDQADCEAHGLATGRTCQQGEVCRDNACQVESCASSADCDQAAPFCATTTSATPNTCGASCDDDTECPGFGGASDAKRCVNGACAMCRESSDCSGTAPICDAGACRACTVDHDCPLGVCAGDGTCPGDAQIAVVASSGSGSTCTTAAPCSLATGVATNKPYVFVTSGAYLVPSTLSLNGTHTIVGGTPRPSLSNATKGPLITITGIAQVALRNLEITGIKLDTTLDDQGALFCDNTQSGTRTLSVRDCDVSHNAGAGIRAHGCAIDVVRSSFVLNGYDGITVTDGSSTIDASLFSQNNGLGLDHDGGTVSVTNSYFVRNVAGVHLYTQEPGGKFTFNTIVDNTDTQSGDPAIQCYSMQAFDASNNIIARNGNNGLLGGTCSADHTVISTSVTDLHFVSPDAAPYDYHLMHGSVAIDAATVSTLDHDFDGDARPKGAARDIGADEAE